MQWDDSRGAGFTTGTPWIKVSEDYKAWNVEKQEGDSGSVLAFWKTLLKTRKEHRGLVYGYFEMLDRGNEQVYAYTRTDDRHEYLVVCSFSGETVLWDCPVERGELMLSNYSVGEGEVDNRMSLRAYEGRLYCRNM